MQGSQHGEREGNTHYTQRELELICDCDQRLPVELISSKKCLRLFCFFDDASFFFYICFF
jgi:hypothetical protein